MDWSGQNFYYSGQGVLLVGKRTALGKPAGLIPVGDVSVLKLAISTAVADHKEHQSGNRSIDFRMPTETKGVLTFTIDKVDGRNLAVALQGTRTDKLAASVSAEAVTGFLGKVTPTKYVKVSSVVVKRGATTLTAYVNDSTIFDYKVNTDAGSIWMNDGSVALIDKATTGGTAPSGIAVGNPTVVTVANSAAVGDYAAFTGFTGADNALVNGKAFEIVVASSTAVSLNVDTTGKTITLGTPLSFFDGQALTIDYSFAGQKIVDALTQALVEKYLRFEGLNTADGNNPVVVEVFRCLFDPLKERNYISDAYDGMMMEGEMLRDVTQQSGGSMYFKETLLR